MVLVSLVTSTSDAVTAQVQALGTDMLSVSILNDQENPIKLSELSDIAQLPEIFSVAPWPSSAPPPRCSMRRRA